uniref:Uncharacterized protein n=1 Tax=Arundo donax TaxID=35708 RepID=A0A0A8Z885_ARUDO
MEDGPWMLRQDLLVIIEFDPMKTVQDMEINHIPAWIRISKLPVDMMNRSMYCRAYWTTSRRCFGGVCG